MVSTTNRCSLALQHVLLLVLLPSTFSLNGKTAVIRSHALIVFVLKACDQWNLLVPLWDRCCSRHFGWGWGGGKCEVCFDSEEGDVDRCGGG